MFRQANASQMNSTNYNKAREREKNKTKYTYERDSNCTECNGNRFNDSEIYINIYTIEPVRDI